MSVVRTRDKIQQVKCIETHENKRNAHKHYLELTQMTDK